MFTSKSGERPQRADKRQQVVYHPTGSSRPEAIRVRRLTRSWLKSPTMVQQSRHMTSRYDDALTGFELTTIQQRHGKFVVVDDLPLMCIAVRNLTEETWITVRHRKMHVEIPYRSMRVPVASQLQEPGP